MNCTTCFGRGWVPTVTIKSRGEIIAMDGHRICDACKGSGKEHCCEGHSACNDVDDENNDK